MHKMRPNSPGILFAAGLSAFSSSCLFHKSPVVFTPPAPVSQPSVPSAPPPQLAPPPRIAGDPSASVPPEVAISIPELAAPPEPPKPQPKKSASTPPPKPVTPVTPEQPSQPPRLGQIFTPEEEREYNRTIDESLNRVKRALGALSRKSLNPDQAKDATRIAEFQKQAEDARDAHDLANADLWAKRAATLADDLLNRVP